LLKYAYSTKLISSKHAKTSSYILTEINTGIRILKNERKTRPGPVLGLHFVIVVILSIVMLNAAKLSVVALL